MANPLEKGRKRKQQDVYAEKGFFSVSK